MKEGILLVKIFIETQNASDCKPLGGQLKNNTLHKCSGSLCVPGSELRVTNTYLYQSNKKVVAAR